ERFTRTVGVAPMEYLLAWRMEIAKDLLRRGEVTSAQVAERMGYGSGSAFSVAFRRHVGMAPGRYAVSVRGQGWGAARALPLGRRAWRWTDDRGCHGPSA